MNINDFKPKKRFSDRVENYVKYRPSYPQGVVDVMRNTYGINRNSVIADIGAGTGIFSKVLLDSSLNVIGVEPNAEMRHYAETYLGSYPAYRSVNGSAEDTTLDVDSVDAIVAAQAFHWFDVAPTLIEFSRILKKDGMIFLVWNDRKTADNAFQQAYNDLLIRYCPDYTRINHKNFSPERLCTVFPGKTIDTHHLDNHQVFDYDSLLGRLKSSSYCPLETDAAYIPLTKALHAIFEAHHTDGHIVIAYDCTLFCIR